MRKYSVRRWVFYCGVLIVITYVGMFMILTNYTLTTNVVPTVGVPTTAIAAARYKTTTTTTTIQQQQYNNNNNSNSSSSSSSYNYKPSSSELYIVNNAQALGYDSIDDPSGCNIWKGIHYSSTSSSSSSNNKNNDDGILSKELSNDLQSYQTDIEHYTKMIQEFIPIPDLMKLIIKEESSSSSVDNASSTSTTRRDDICAMARLHPKDKSLQAMFPSNQLSFTPISGYIEPLLPPMRDSRLCTYDLSAKNKFWRLFESEYWNPPHLMSIDYLVHDFEYMCHQLKPTSKRILIDMGASLTFHSKDKTPPIVELLELYEKFGFHFDHIYAFEMTFTTPQDVYETLLPEKYIPIYHWINVGVNSTEGHKLNPLHSILSTFDEDDFIVIKLDIDTSSIEVPLAYQLLEGGKNGIYHKRIDQFYFEHHVHLKELATNWRESTEGSIKDSLDLFYGLREKGIPAHFWP